MQTLTWLLAALALTQTSGGPDTYPPEALRRHEEGRVVTHLHVGTDGRVLSCAINKSSGSKALDEDACAKLLKRAHFSPAHDANGNAIEGDADIPINYQLPG